MIEILVLYYICKRLGEYLRGKGRKPLLLQILLVLFWFGGEFLAGVAAGLVQAMRHRGVPQEFDFTIYGAALVGAACGAGVVWSIAKLLPPLEPEIPSASHFGPHPGVPREWDFPPDDPNNPYTSPRSPF